MMNKTVFVAGDGVLHYERMFEEKDWNVTNNILMADVVQFTGGADVDPSLYNEKKHRTTTCYAHRDMMDIAAYETAQYYEIPCAGICRGSQFLNVMNGGKLWQHVDRHALGHTHRAWDNESHVYNVTSTHHQMMKPSKWGHVLGWASESKARECMKNDKVFIDKSDACDVEVVYYKKTNSLCFQPHPEFVRAPDECTDWYFKLINEHLFGG